LIIDLRYVYRESRVLGAHAAAELRSAWTGEAPVPTRTSSYPG
jgi:hypothetical protein